MIKVVKKHISRAINHLGFDLSRFDRRSSRGLRFLQLMRDYQIDTVFDIGANVGQYAKLVRNYGFKGRIISFEPLSEAHIKLVKKQPKGPGVDSCAPYGPWQ